MISKEQIENIVNKIVKNVNPQKVILFGSYAYGNPDENSDLDLLIVKDTDVPIYKREREIRKFLRGTQIPIDIIVHTQNEIEQWKDTKASFINQIYENGKVLYG